MAQSRARCNLCRGPVLVPNRAVVYYWPMWSTHAARLGRAVFLSLLLLATAVAIAPEWPAFQAERHRLNSLVGLREFDYLTWFGEALFNKAKAAAAGSQHYLDEAERKALVLDYLARVGEVRRLQSEIERVYADPEIADPERAAAALHAALLAARAAASELQPTAEAIIQEQVASVLAEEGFGFLGQIVPPVQMRMTPLPLVLIVSPRERIAQLYNVPLEHGLSIVTREELESAIDQELDRSSLVVPIGGMGFYPSMIIETSDLSFLMDVVAHEWTHQWLTLRPLGRRYLASPEMRTINETVASIAGAEVGAAVVARFYPELVPAPLPAAPVRPAPEEPPAFDYQAEMAETRRRVDELLAAGKVEEAEAYMEARRVLFVENGYLIRKLNQAYFAFYGAYADTPGAAGEDPVGPAVVALREQSASLHEFLQRVAPIASFAELQEELSESS